MWLLDEWQPLAADKMERLGKKGWEIKRSKGGGKAEGRWGEGLCNRWSECSLTAGEYARLPQSDKWLSRSQDSRTGKKKTGGKTVFICSRAVTGRKLLFLKRERERNTVMEKNIRFLRNTKAHGRLSLTQVHADMRQKRHGERVKEAKKQRQINRACGQKPPCQRWYLFWALFFQFGGMNYSWRRSV